MRSGRERECCAETASASSGNGMLCAGERKGDNAHGRGGERRE